MKKVYLKNLGCPKNEVDGRILLAMLESRGVKATDNPGQADIIIVNTCGFIEDAKQESIEETLQLAQHKAHNNSILVMSGCLSQRYRQEIEAEMPDITKF